MSEITDALKLGVEEIKRLRKENEIMKAKVEVMNSFFSVVGAVRPTPDYSGGYAVPHDPLDIMEKSLEVMRKVDKVNDRLTPQQSGALAGKANQEQAAEAYLKQAAHFNKPSVGTIHDTDEFP